MVRTISVVFRRGVFVPLAPVSDIDEETTFEIEIHGSLEDDVRLEDAEAYTFEENLQLLHESSGMLGGALPEDEVRYIIESPDSSFPPIRLST
jgi:hypothetical protein